MSDDVKRPSRLLLFIITQIIRTNALAHHSVLFSVLRCTSVDC